MSESSNQVSEAVDLRQVVVISPALNEEESLPLVLNDLPEVAVVFIVDNGCTDQTPQIAESMGATVVKCPIRGYGAACLAGIAAANQWATEPDNASDPVVVFLDADYSDHVHLLPNIVERIFTEESDFVLGSRLLGEREKGAMPPQSVWGESIRVWSDESVVQNQVHRSRPVSSVEAEFAQRFGDGGYEFRLDDRDANQSSQA